MYKTYMIKVCVCALVSYGSGHKYKVRMQLCFVLSNVTLYG